MAAPVFAYPGELLHQASIYDQTDLLKSLLQTGAQGDVNSRDPSGLTPLHTAAVHDSMQCLEELLKWGANPNAVSPKHLVTPLHMAARNGHLRCLKVLVDGGADIDIKNTEQKTALQVAFEEQHMNCVRYLTTVEEIRRATHEEQIRQELLNGCVNGDTATVEQLIGLVNQSAIRQVHQGGSTMLYKASRGGHFEIVKLLLEHGADDTPNAFTGVTPLYAACFEGHVEVASLLARTMPHSISTAGQNDRSTPLHVASDKGLEAVIKILLQAPSETEEPAPCSAVDLNAATASGMTPLHLAAQGGFLKVVKLLVECEHKCLGPCEASTKLRIDERNIIGRTALHDAITLGYRDIVKYLVQHGANINLPVDVEQSQIGGDPGDLSRAARQLAESSVFVMPLEIACRQGGGLDMVSLLLDNGADDPGNKCLEFACNSKNDDLVALLLRKGVHVDQEDKFSTRASSAAAEGWRQSSDAVSIMWNSKKLSKVLEQWVASSASFINPHLEAVPGGAHPALRTITRVDLSENQLESLPLVIFQLPSLKMLNASKNSICGFPSRRLGQKKEADLENGAVNGRLSSSCDNVGQGIATEEKDFTYPESGWNCPHLEELELQNNELIALPTCLFQLPLLKFMNVSNNLVSSLPFAVWTAPALKRLDLKSNRLKKLPLTKTRMRSFCGKASTLPRAKVISAEKEKETAPRAVEVTPPKPGAGAPQQQLTVFCHRQLWGSRGTEDVDESDSDDEDIDPAKGASLQKLDLSSNGLKEVPRGLPCLAPNLNQLNLSRNSIAEVKSLALFPSSLGTLDLSHNKLQQFQPFADDSARAGTKCLSPFEGQRSAGRPRAHTEGALGTSGKARFCRHARHQALAQLKRLDMSDNMLQEFPITLPDKRPSSTKEEGSAPATPKHKQRSSVADVRAGLLFPSLQSLMLDDNPLTSLPRDIGLLTKLGSLHVNRTEITKLPEEVGLLCELWDLQYRGVTLQNIEPSVLERKKISDIVGYLRSVLEKSRPYPSMKLMFVGVSNIGKTTLLGQLRLEGTTTSPPGTVPVGWTDRQNRRKTTAAARRGKQERNMSTVGVDVSDWTFRPKKAEFPLPGRGDARPNIKFVTWDFGGQQEYYATHQCFLSHRSLYLAMWKVTDGERGVSEIEPWLLNIQARAMDSPVIIVGTHYDLLSPEQRKSDHLTTLRQMIRERYVAMEFGGGVQTPRERGLPRVMAAIEVSCKTGYHIKELRQLIYVKAFEIKKKGSSVPLIETPVPASYLAVEEAVLKLRERCYRDDQTPIMKAEQFRGNIEIELQKQGVHLRDTEELDQATNFLHDNGVLLHYDGPLLRDLYFLDPQWLCDMLAHVVTIREVNPHINNGVMRLADLSHIFRSDNFPANLMEKYIDLLSKFEVALRWSQDYLLVPSLLPCKQQDKNQPLAPGVSPSVAQAMSTAAYTQLRVLRRQYVMSYVPSGFWPRLITRVIFDERVRSVVRSLCQFPSDSPGDEQSKVKPTAQPDWSCWKSGVELTCFGVKLLRVCELEGLPFYGAPEDAAHPFHFRDEAHDTSGYSTVEVITTCVSIEMERSGTKLARNRGRNDGGETRRVIGFRVRSVTEGRVQPSARLLTIIAEHIDNLITDWFPGLDTLTVHGYRLVTRLIPCPACITMAAAPSGSSADQTPEESQEGPPEPAMPCVAPGSPPDSGVNVTTDGSSASASPWPSPVHTKASRAKSNPNRQPGNGIARPSGSLLSDRLRDLGSSPRPQTLPAELKADLFSFGFESSGHGTDESSSYVDYTSDQSSDSSSCGQPTPRRVARREPSSGSEGSREGSREGAGSAWSQPANASKGSTESVGSAGSGFQRSGNYGSFRRRPTGEDRVIYGFEFEELVQRSYFSKPIVCKEHGELPIRELAPDAVFEDIAPDMNIQASDLSRDKFLGKGTFGSVFRGKLRDASGEHRVVAMKMPLNNEVDEQARPEERQAAEAAQRALRDSPTLTLNDAFRTIRQEISILLPLYHPNIVSLLGHCLNPFCMVLEFAPGGALDRMLATYRKSGVRLNPFVMQKCITQCASALKYLHKHNIIYRDLKSENILVWSFPDPFFNDHRSHEVLIKLADYGISRSAALSGVKGLGGTPGFMAPEIEKFVGKEVYTNKVDSFSFGMYIYELITLHQPFHDLNPAQVKQMVVEGLRPHLTSKDKRAPVFALDLMAWCWQQEAEARPPSSHILALASTPEFPRLSDVLTFDKQLSLNCAVTAGSRLSLGCGVDGRPSVGGELWLCRGELSAGIGVGKVSILSYAGGRLQHKQEVTTGKSCIRVACSVGSTVWLGTESGSLLVYCAVTYKLLCQGTIKSNKYVLSMIHVPRCNSVLLALQDGSVLSYNDNICNHYHYPDSSTRTRVHELTHSRAHPGNGNPVHCMAALPVKHPPRSAAQEPNEGDELELREDELVCEVWCGQEIGQITVLNGDELSQLFTMPAEDSDAQSMRDQSVSHLETCRTFGADIQPDEPVARSVWVALFPGTRVFRWDAASKSVVGSVDCAQYTPKNDDSRNRATINRQAQRAGLPASRAQVNSLVAVDKELYIGTSLGCVLVCHNLSLMLFTVIRQHVESVKQLLPLTIAPAAWQQSADRRTALVLSCGRGYRRLGEAACTNSYPSKQSRKPGAALARSEPVLLVWLADGWDK